jgi:hypothetical protein
MMATLPRAAALALPALTGALVATSALCGGAHASGPQEVSASLRAGDSRLRIVEVSTDPRNRERRFLRESEVLYRSRLNVDGESWLWSVDIAHPYQIGRIRIRAGRADGLNPDGSVLWSGRTPRALCLPELLPEVAVAYDAAIRKGGFACMTPVPKAKKLAPLSIRRLADGKDGRRRYEVGPGSLGMRLFIDASVLEVTADGVALLAQRGQFEAAWRAGRFRYIEGDAVYAAPRRIAPLPGAFHATKDTP